MADERCLECGAEAVWLYMPGNSDRAYCEDHVPERGCPCLADVEPDSQGRLSPCVEYVWIGPTGLEPADSPSDPK